jgi:hypothetical protein
LIVSVMVMAEGWSWAWAWSWVVLRGAGKMQAGGAGRS